LLLLSLTAVRLDVHSDHAPRIEFALEARRIHPLRIEHGPVRGKVFKHSSARDCGMARRLMTRRVEGALKRQPIFPSRKQSRLFMLRRARRFVIHPRT
jgi:hypothetical protein